MNAEQVFLIALEKELDSERDRFLDSVFLRHPELKQEVKELLRAHDGAGDFLSSPLVDPLDRDPQPKPGMLPAGALIGPYRVIRMIGRGGMGIVYLASDPRLDRQVAVKVLSPQRSADEQWVRRFRREARAASGLNHPNILTIHEVGETQGTHFIATEFVDGITLRGRLSLDRLPVETAVDFARQMASALAVAHTAGICHRDLKPDNVMIRDDGLLKILDFGLAKVFRHPLLGESTSDQSQFSSTPGQVIGTLNYMSPEQARGQETDARTDVFSFGIMLYQMLTGRHPFKADSATDVLASILDRAPQPLADHGGEVPAELSRLVHRCLNKDKTRRPALGEIALELAAFRGVERPGEAGKKETKPAFAVPVATEADSGTSGRQASLTAATPRLPVVRYARSGDVNIAWQELGSGPIDVVFVMGWVSHLEWFWREPSFASFLRRLASFSRVILFDKRGTGLSDRVPVGQLPTLEQRVDDVRAVMEAAGSQQAVLCGVSEGGPMCTLFAATHPQRTIALIMLGSYARRLWAEDYPWGPTPEQRELFLDEIRQNWGGPVGIDTRAPSRADDPGFRDWWASYLRMGASPGAAVALTNMNAQIDVRAILPGIQVPTLVIHRQGDRCLRIEEGRYLADRIPGAKFVELPGADHLPFVGDQAAVIDEIQEFLTGVRRAEVVDSVLVTVLAIAVEHVPLEAFDRTEFQACADGPGGAAPGLGHPPADEHSALTRFSGLVAREILLFRGQNLHLAERTIVATFDGPARAVRAGVAVSNLARRLEINVRVGVHTGQCEIRDGHAGGKAVELAGRIARRASIGQVLVSDSVRNLVSGAGLELMESPGLAAAGEAEPIRLFDVIR